MAKPATVQKQTPAADQTAPAAKPATPPAAPAPAAKIPAPKPARKALQGRLAEAAYQRNEWRYTAEAGTTINEILDPQYWAHVAANFKPHDIIEVIPEDGSWYARLIVLTNARLWAKVFLLQKADLEKALADTPATDDETHEVKWMGAIEKHAVIRKADKALIKGGFTTKLEAHTWLDSYLKSISG